MTVEELYIVSVISFLQKLTGLKYVEGKPLLIQHLKRKVHTLIRHGTLLA